MRKVFNAHISFKSLEESLEKRLIQEMTLGNIVNNNDATDFISKWLVTNASSIPYGVGVSITDEDDDR